MYQVSVFHLHSDKSTSDVGVFFFKFESENSFFVFLCFVLKQKSVAQGHKDQKTTSIFFLCQNKALQLATMIS